MHKGLLITGIVCAAIAVILGAFGAHGLKSMVEPSTVSTFETGVRYQVYHAFAILFSGMLYYKFKHGWVSVAGYLFLTGIILFSGSLYLLTFLKATDTVGLAGLGIITPFGGLFFIAGWISLLFGILKGDKKRKIPNV